MELSQPEANDNQITYQPGDILPGVTEFFQTAQKKTVGAKAHKNFSKTKKQKAKNPGHSESSQSRTYANPALMETTTAKKRNGAYQGKSYAW